jgi:hypothetical protein
MLSTLDILYLVLSVCVIAITIMIVLLGSELLRVVRDLRSIANNVEQVTHLVRRIASILFPGAERVVQDASDIEGKIHSFLTRNFHTRDSKKRKD